MNFSSNKEHSLVNFWLLYSALVNKIYVNHTLCCTCCVLLKCCLNESLNVCYVESMLCSNVSGEWKSLGLNSRCWSKSDGSIVCSLGSKVGLQKGHVWENVQCWNILSFFSYISLCAIVIPCSLNNYILNFEVTF